jgi:ACS family tartrate transporter-like MFS transporter
MSIPAPTALNRARRKAYIRLLPLLFLCYVIAYVDRNNLSIAIKTMRVDMPSFNDDVLGTGAGVFFLGYFLLEIPGTLLVEKWSARKWISRIMISWGIVAALTACVKTPTQFYAVRALLGLAEAGFFPGVIVYLTHWFPSRDRTRALSWFLIGTPVAQAASPILSYPLLKIGTNRVVSGHAVHYPELLGLEGWQWVFIAWGIPAVVLGIIVLFLLTDRPHQARWLEPEEREALETELERERALHGASQHMRLVDGLRQPKVLLLAAAYFFIVTGNYGVEYFLPSILEKWYMLDEDQLRWLLVIPAAGSLIGQRFIGWNSDRTMERRAHTVIPIYIGAAALSATVLYQYPLILMMVLFTIAATGLKAYLPAFWSLPSLFLTQTAAAGSIGLINSVGNLGGFIGPKAMGWLSKHTGSYTPGITILCASMVIAASIVLVMPIGHRLGPTTPELNPLAEADAIIEPV